ncbi:exodeoxyribonuclease VII large subunit [Aromatoleum toluclasticum]|uniref:exodeoxyribonuclease VII large subunit n=1 Tax=Aromatoleum toluclasticum TaxID=92003 RepID=UPI001D187862|nr:exodeoxyribonuclease VII large subunit [Aromatoleum toluclasticum]MCC4116845.1 exodeoxyribonuclease VII large subunit [Aromatoleum toluclasticum]
MQNTVSFPAGGPGDTNGAGRAISVSALNRVAREALEARFPLLWVSGEISNLTRAPSGHLYFTLKDAQAQVRCTMWRNRAQLLPFRPENGMRVDARSLVTLYEARGDFQLSVEALRQTGQGNLFEAFLRLKEKLAVEGLFDPAAKRELPPYPRRIGVVTSPAAAAWKDVLAALQRRAPHLVVVLYPSPVQGADAGAKLAEAVRTADARAAEDGIDLLLVVRGGGSIEDLWAFNDEALARAIRACTVPVVSGVGHETDFTIADFAADVRAATPTGAAELASAGYHAARARTGELERSLSAGMERRLHGLAQRLDRAALRLVHPRERLGLAHERSERLAVRLSTAMTRRIERLEGARRILELRLGARKPDLRREMERCARAAQRLGAAGEQVVQRRAERLAALATHLQHLAPQAVLARGYSITRDAEGRILRIADEAAAGEEISVELAIGRLRAIVNSTEA